MATHRAQGHRTVYVDGDSIVAAEGSWRETIHLRDVPITRNGKIGFQVENVMAAWRRLGRGLPWQTIRRGLSGFVNDSDNAPGPLQHHGLPGATVIADYGHNPDAMRALVPPWTPARQAPQRGHQRRRRPPRRRHPRADRDPGRGL
jgi:cyanophycin synthetase